MTVDEDFNSRMGNSPILKPNHYEKILRTWCKTWTFQKTPVFYTQKNSAELISSATSSEISEIPTSFSRNSIVFRFIYFFHPRPHHERKSIQPVRNFRSVSKFIKSWSGTFLIVTIIVKFVRSCI